MADASPPPTSSAGPRVPVHLRQPTPGWNVASYCPRLGPASSYGTQPLPSSFGDNPLGYQSGTAKIGKGLARQPLTSQCHTRTGLVGNIMGAQDLYGSSTATIISSKVWPGKVAEMEDWKLRKGFGSTPSYGAHHEAMRLTTSSILSSGISSRSSLRISESTMRMTEHPLSWAKMRRPRGPPASWANSTMGSSMSRRGSQRCGTAKGTRGLERRSHSPATSTESDMLSKGTARTCHGTCAC